LDYRAEFKQVLKDDQPILALAPMQEVTDWAFWRLMARYGGPDVYFTEYFRVYANSRLDKNILKSVVENPTGKPAIAQMIGSDVTELVRTARELQHYPVAAVDLNLGCPAPVVYRKCAGGGLLREPQRVDVILGSLREVLSIPFTVKTRIGFDSPEVFDELLPIFAKHSLDLLTVHGRTVKEMYRSEVHYNFIRRAVEAVECPVLANGNVYSAEKAEEVLRDTGARGLMIGRGAIRNPWLFAQFRQLRRAEPLFVPRGRDVLEYIHALYAETCHPHAREQSQVQHMKRFMNYLGLGVDTEGRFLNDIRRVDTRANFFAVCNRFLDHDEPMPLEPFKLRLKETDLLSGVHR
jgi:nifR3 family TIM-barrel protein